MVFAILFRCCFRSSSCLFVGIVLFGGLFGLFFLCYRPVEELYICCRSSVDIAGFCFSSNTIAGVIINSIILKSDKNMILIGTYIPLKYSFAYNTGNSGVKDLNIISK